MSNGRTLPPSAWLHLAFLGLATLSFTGASFAQTEPAPYARKNSFGLLAAYANDSSHILLGDAEKRKLFDIGASYSRKLLLTRFGELQYDAELLPVALEGDPMEAQITHETSPKNITITEIEPTSMASCRPITQSFSFTIQGVTYAQTLTIYCKGRIWTIGESMSPVGFQWNFLPHRRIQPLIEAHGGYMYSTKAIPTIDAGSFNFTFDMGGRH